MYLDPSTREKLINTFRGRYPESPSGYLDKQQILEAVAGEEKERVLAWLEAALIAMDHSQLETIFGDWVRERFVRALKPDQVLAAIHRFQQDSVAGKYYAPFAMDSKNYDQVPPETEAWFDELSTWLDRSCELAEAGEEQAALEALTILLDLIENMTQEVVFAHELGEWMIPTRRDYRAMYRRLKSGND